MTLVGVKSRNHPQQVARLGVDDSIDDRRTPDSVWLPLHSDHSFTVDVAASAANWKVPRHFTRETDGLAQSWRGERVWCNPPYSDIGAWVKKATEEMAMGCELVCMLLPANRTEQTWWQEYIEPWRDADLDEIRLAPPGVRELTTRFLSGRIRFGRPEGAALPKKGDRPPFGLVVVTWRGA